MHFQTHYLSLIIKHLKTKPWRAQDVVDNEFLSLLRERNVLVAHGEEQNLLRSKHSRREAASLDCSHLALTICPTLSCNFNCPYCFEDTTNHKGVMQPGTVDKLVTFIANYEQADDLSIIWFGGEPVIGFRAICDITERIKKLDISFKGARLITNGYLLTREKVERFNDLNIGSVQITLDGPQRHHDKRRTLRSGRPTYQRIIDNIHTLMNSTYRGNCIIRVNVDKTNMGEFVELRSTLMEELGHKPVYVYPARVESAGCPDYGCDRTLRAQEWSDYVLEMYRVERIIPPGGLYPNSTPGLCVAERENGFVIGPEGELYKCWEDAGNPNMLIGSLYHNPYVTRPELITMYRRGTDPYHDEVCRKCRTLPICSGGCANRRLRTKFDHQDGLEFCSPFKDNLISWLEAYCDAFACAEICRRILQRGVDARKHKGYRMIQPSLNRVDNRFGEPAFE